MLNTKIKELRLLAGLTQKELADKAGITYPEVSLIETGRLKPSVGQLAKITKALEVGDLEAPMSVLAHRIVSRRFGPLAA